MTTHCQDFGVIDETGEWEGNSFVTTRTRTVGKSRTIMVDVTEHGPRTSKKRADAAARRAARQASATPLRKATGTLIFDQESVRSSKKMDENGHISETTTKVRSSTFSFTV